MNGLLRNQVFFLIMFILNENKITHSKCLLQPMPEKQEIKHLYNMNLEASGPYFTFVRQ